MRWLVVALMVSAVILSGCLTENTEPGASKNYCSIDEDCVLKVTGCKDCSPMYDCVNKDWELQCDFNKGIVCPPAPQWATTCKCIESKCANCRDIFPVEDGKMECKDNGQVIVFDK